MARGGRGSDFSRDLERGIGELVGEVIVNIAVGKGLVGGGEQTATGIEGDLSRGLAGVRLL